MPFLLPVRPAASAVSSVSGVPKPPGCDQMEELELEPLVDGIDDFEW
jgi:hypothetical protein